MVKINIVVVGKIKEKFYTDAINEYIKRLSRFANVSIKELAEENNDKTLKKEGEAILKELKGYVIVLAVEGQKLSSEKLAEKIQSVIDCGKEITFVIGSSYGLCEKVKDIADFKLSFSDMTFPHQLMRVILCEQIYRSFMILSNSEYHK